MQQPTSGQFWADASRESMLGAKHRVDGFNSSMVPSISCFTVKGLRFRVSGLGFGLGSLRWVRRVVVGAGAFGYFVRCVFRAVMVYVLGFRVYGFEV